MRENLLPRVLSIKIICLGFSRSREMGKKREVHTSEKRKASVRTYKTYVQNPRGVYFAIHIHPTYIYCTHKRTHPWDLTHLKSMKAAAIGQSEDLARPSDVLNPSAVVKRMPESLEFDWKCSCPAVLFHTVAQIPACFTSLVGKRGGSSFS